MAGADHELLVFEGDHGERQSGQGTSDVGFECSQSGRLLAQACEGRLGSQP
jgi:hypothetical protein